MTTHRYTLYKNGQEIIHGLKRSTFLQTFDAMRRKSPDKCGMMGMGNDLLFTAGKDMYYLKACHLRVVS